MVQTFDQIAELAEFIAEENITRGKANLEKIARQNDVGIHYGQFENYFTGMLQHENGLFDIFINLTKLKNKKYARSRFTLAHELGHYCIDAHRNLLKNGYSLSYDKDLSYFPNDLVEKEANHFATNLLMPQSRFKADLKKYGMDIKAVITISEQYVTSRMSTIIQYRNLLDKPSLLVFWENNQDFKKKNFSDSFYNSFKQFSKTFQINEEVKEKVFEGFNHLFMQIETTTIESTLSKFFSGITTNSVFDKPVIVETMNLHSFGYVSLVRLSE